MDEGIFRPNFDLKAFFDVSASYVKYLIRARWKFEPRFLSENQISNWKLNNIADDRETAPQLLRLAAIQLRNLYSGYLRQRCGSGGIELTDQSTAEGRLLSNLTALVFNDWGVGILEDQLLVTAAKTIAAGEKSDWESEVDWTLLDQIRMDLDEVQLLISNGARRDSEQDSKTITSNKSYQFTVRGNYYLVQGERACISYLKSLGLFYIHHLLTRSGRYITSAELLRLANQLYHPSDGKVSSDEIAEELSEAILSTAGTIHDGEVTDGEGIEAIFRRLDHIATEIETARSNNDLGRVDLLSKEKGKLESELRKSIGSDGQLRVLKLRVKNNMDKVRKAVDRALEQIQEGNPQLGSHLKESIAIGHSCSYQPVSPISWNF